MVDTRDLKSLGHCDRAGSSPASGTQKIKVKQSAALLYFNKIFRRSIGISIITKIPMTGEIYQLSFSL